MEYRVSYGKWNIDGASCTQRVNVEMTAQEFLDLNGALCLEKCFDPVRVGESVPSIETTAKVVDWMGRTERFKTDRDTVLKITLTDANSFIPGSEFDREGDRTIRLSKVGRLFVAAVPYSLMEEVEAFCVDWLHIEPAGGMRKFLWFENNRLYPFGIMCAKRRITSRILKKPLFIKK